MTKRAMVLFVCLLLNSCAGTAQMFGNREPMGATAKRSGTILKVLSRCPSDLKRWVDPEAAVEAIPALPVVAAISGTLVEQLVDYGAEYVKTREKKLSASASARDNVDFYTIEGTTVKARNQCVVLVRGELGPDGLFQAWKSKAEKAPLTEREAFWKDRVGVLRESVGIPLVREPKMYSEFRIRYDSPSDARAAWLQMNMLDFGATAAERVGSGVKDLVFTFVFEAPGSTGDANVRKFAKFDVAIPKTPIGARWGSDDLVDIVSTVQSLPPTREDGKQPPSPVRTSVLGTLTETENAGDIELAVARAVDKHRGQIAEALVDELKRLLGINNQEK